MRRLGKGAVVAEGAATAAECLFVFLRGVGLAAFPPAERNGKRSGCVDWGGLPFLFALRVEKLGRENKRTVSAAVAAPSAKVTFSPSRPHTMYNLYPDRHSPPPQKLFQKTILTERNVRRYD